MSHTPGPWKCGDDEPFVYALNDANTNRFFAGIQGGWLTEGARNRADDKRTPLDEVMANARLIAAAPDLLEALKWYVHYHGNTNAPIETFEGYLGVAERAIAKAEGK